MSLRQILASRFGHFASTPRADDGGDDGDDEAKKAAAAKKAEEDEAARKKAEEEEEAKRARKARRARRAKKNDEDEDGDDAADDDEDDDDGEEMKKAAAAGHTFALEAAFRDGARAQRRRCAAILAHAAASTNPVLAMSLAFETSMTASGAIAVLEKTPAPARGNSLSTRMATSPAAQIRVPTGAPEGPRGAAAVEASWDNALKGFGAATR